MKINYLSALAIVLLLYGCQTGKAQDVAVVNANQIESTDIKERTIIGYSNKHTVRAGDEIEFKVSTFKNNDVNAQLVRVINGDSLSKYREHFKMEHIQSDFEGKIEVAKQELHLGSYIQINNAESLNDFDKFTIGGYFHPTFLPSEYTFPEKIDPFSPPSVDIATSLEDQTLFSRINYDEKMGWALQLDSEGQLMFLHGNGKTIEKYVSGIKVKTWDWSYIGISADVKANTVNIMLMENPWSAGDKFVAQNISASINLKSTLISDNSLRIGAISKGSVEEGRTYSKPIDVFTGRVQDIRFFNKQLSKDELEMLKQNQLPSSLSKAQVCYWDFSKGIGTGNIYDSGSLKLHGKAVNVPLRAIRGIFWDKESVNWQDNVEGYNAIHLHADDLADAEWTTNFKYTVPKKLKSGIYAAKLTQDGFDEYITFFVAAPKEKPQAKIALWLSDFNYLAYANVSIGIYAYNNYPGHNWNKSDADFFEKNKEYATGGIYNKHVDGSYYTYGTRLRPDLGMKPNGILAYNFVEDTHISDFLETMGYDYDIITDELIDKEGVELLNKYPVVITATHPEYPTGKIYDATKTYTEDGGRLMYIGANGFFMNASVHPVNSNILVSRNFTGLGERFMENGDRGGLVIEAGKIPWSVVGVHCVGMVFDGSSPYTKTSDANNPRASWMFEGTTEGNVFGNYGIDRVKGGAAGYEVDAADFSKGTPRNALILAEGSDFEGLVEDIVVTQIPLGVYYYPSPESGYISKASMTFFETPNGGAVFTTGSITWISSALENNYKNDIATITKNVIDRFLDPKPFPKIDKGELEKVNRQLGNPEYE